MPKKGTAWVLSELTQRTLSSPAGLLNNLQGTHKQGRKEQLKAISKEFWERSWKIGSRTRGWSGNRRWRKRSQQIWWFHFVCHGSVFEHNRFTATFRKLLFSYKTYHLHNHCNRVDVVILIIYGLSYAAITFFLLETFITGLFERCIPRDCLFLFFHFLTTRCTSRKFKIVVLVAKIVVPIMGNLPTYMAIDLRQQEIFTQQFLVRKPSMCHDGTWMSQFFPNSKYHCGQCCVEPQM